MPDAALTGSRRLELSRIGLDRRNQLADVLVWGVGAHLQARRIGIDQTDRRIRRAAKVGQPLPVHHPDLNGHHSDRISIGRSRRDRRMADNSAASRAIDHVDRLSQLLFKQRADDPRGRVGAAARAPRNDQGDRALRIRGLRRH